MKTVSGKVTSTTPITLSQAAKTLSDFASSQNGASHAVSLYLGRASDSFNRLVKAHEKLRPNWNEQEQEKAQALAFGENKDDITDGGDKKSKSLDCGTRNKNMDSSKKSVKIEHFSVKDEDLVKNNETPDGENKKSRSLEGDMGNKNMGSLKKSKKSEQSSVKGEDLVKYKDSPDGGNKKSKSLGDEEEHPEGDMRNNNMGSSKKSKKSEHFSVKAGDLVKNKDSPDGENKKRKRLDKEKHNPEADTRSKNKGSSKIIEDGVGDVEENGTVSREKKKKKKKRSAGDGEDGVGKIEEVSGFRKEEERKSVDDNAGEQAGSTGQSYKKKSKKKRIEGEM